MMKALAAMVLLLQGTTAGKRSLSEEEFARLHQALRPPSGEGWTKIAWKTSLVQACVQAARGKRPLFMVVRSGQPLGCV